MNFSTWYFKASNRVYNITTGKETEICEYNDFSPFTFAFSISSGGYGSPCAQVLKVYTSQSVLVQSWIYWDGSFLKDHGIPNYPTTKSQWTSYCSQSQLATFKDGKWFMDAMLITMFGGLMIWQEKFSIVIKDLNHVVDI
jgi:hypothetical protein